VYRAEFDARLLALTKTVLAPAAVNALVDEGVAAFSMKDWMETPARPSCDVTARTATIRRWIGDRHAVVQERLGSK
jgi:hypothetical protein